MESGGKSPANPELKEGDVFYVMHDGSYQVYKMLAHDSAVSCYHVLVYESVTARPSAETADHLEVSIYHVPIDAEGFRDPVVMANAPVLAHELVGYHEYLRQTRHHEDYTQLAMDYFNDGLRLTDENRHRDAIDAYSKAADLFPLFYEALDNRAFCKMDLALWEEAIEDFYLSLQVYPESVLAEFSIGECYLRLKRYPEAKAQFEKALAIDPDHQLSRDFMENVKALL